MPGIKCGHGVVCGHTLLSWEDRNVRSCDEEEGERGWGVVAIVVRWEVACEDAEPRDQERHVRVQRLQVASGGSAIVLLMMLGVPCMIDLIFTIQFCGWRIFL